jgi:hypothetical protein
MNADEPLEPAPAIRRGFPLYSNCYNWYLLLAVLDIGLTWIILHGFGGYEVNVLANWIIRSGGFWATVGYKFALVGLVIAICEVVGRRVDATGRRLAEWAVAITAIPVTASFVQLLVDVCAWLLRGP